MPSNNDHKILITVAYKLLNDLLFLLIIFIALMFVAESILPGFVSAYLSFTKIILFFLAVLAVAIYLGRKYDLSFPFSSGLSGSSLWKNKLFISVAVLFILFVARSLWKFNVWQIIIITVVSFAIFFYFQKTIAASGQE